MRQLRADIQDILQQEKRWHLQQVSRIEKAIDAAKFEEPFAPRQKTSWTAEIQRVFQEHHELTPEEIVRRLVENGVTDAAVVNRRMNVYATLHRLIKQGNLEKTSTGAYREKHVI